jgi:hypothetical protein
LSDIKKQKGTGSIAEMVKALGNLDVLGDFGVCSLYDSSGCSRSIDKAQGKAEERVKMVTQGLLMHSQEL